MDWKLLSCALFWTMLLPPECRSSPIAHPNLDVASSKSVQNSSSNAVIRVIVSSSSASRSYGGHAYHHTIFHRPTLPVLPTSTVPTPTTYHPHLPSLPFKPSAHFTRPPLTRQNPFIFDSQRSTLEATPPADIFSVFYHAFSQHNSAETFSTTPSPITLSPIVSVVSKSHSVSSSEVVPAPLPKNLKKSHRHMPHRRSNDAAEYQRDTDPPPIRREKPKWLDNDDFMFQSDQPSGSDEQDHNASAVPPALLNWEVPEKVWAEPEKVWGEPEQNWELAEKWESQKEPAAPAPVDSSDDDESSVRFYELGEDEDDEPKELLLDERSIQETIETAQLAARSWELPELSHLGMIPNQSFVRSAPDGMASEAIQLPYRSQAIMPKVRMTLEPVTRAKAIHSTPESSTPSAVPEASRGKKFGYVLDGSNVRKYRVEERTPDGYIVGEYGVLNNNNGFLRGVRYTADGTINPRLIHEALMKFLAL